MLTCCKATPNSSKGTRPAEHLTAQKIHSTFIYHTWQQPAIEVPQQEMHQNHVDLQKGKQACY